MTHGYRAVLRQRTVRTVLSVSVLARVPLGMSTLSLLLLVRQQTGSFGIAGFAVGAFGLGGAIGAPVLAASVDRLGPVVVVRGSAATQAALFLLLVAACDAGAAPALLSVCAGAAGFFTPPLSASVRALWPTLALGDGVLDAAYALDATTQEIIFMLGPLVVTGVVAVASPTAAVVLAAAITLVGALAFTGLPSVRSWRPEARRPRAAQVRSSRGLGLILVSVLLCGMCIGVVEVGLPALAAEVGAASLAGTLLAGWSVGSIVGGVIYASRPWQMGLPRRYGALLVLCGMLTVPLAFTGSLAVGLLFSVVAGLMWAPMFACQYALIAASARPGETTAAFGWNTSVTLGGVALGAVTAGSLVETGGPRLAVLAGAAALLLAATAVIPIGRTRSGPLEG